LTPETAAEIQRLGTPTIHILGGEHAIPRDVEEQLAAAGHVTHRHAGATAASTAVSVAEMHFPSSESAILVGYDPKADPIQAVADTAAVGALAAARRVPVLLTEGSTVSTETLEYIGRSAIRSVLIVGDQSNVGPTVDEELARRQVNVTRLTSRDRFSAAVAIAQERGFRHAQQAATVLLADGSGSAAWPSGLAAAAHATEAPVILSNGTELPVATRSYLATAATGTPLVCMPGVPPGTCAAARAVMNGS
jgi:putative cell wall-binding protein